MTKKSFPRLYRTFGPESEWDQRCKCLTGPTSKHCSLCQPNSILRVALCSGGSYQPVLLSVYDYPNSTRKNPYLKKYLLCFIIEHEVREIMHLVASVHPFFCALTVEPFNVRPSSFAWRPTLTFARLAM